jgi:hypothetical protein
VHSFFICLLYVIYQYLCFQLQITIPLSFSGFPTLLTSRPNIGGDTTPESLRDGSFGIHDVARCLSFLANKKSMKNVVWVGGKDYWLVVSSNRCDIQLLNLITRVTVELPSFSTVDMYATHKSLDLIQASQDCTRTMRRIGLCQTPFDRGGHKAISPFNKWEIGYASKGDTGWRTIKCAKYFIEKFL